MFVDKVVIHYKMDNPNLNKLTWHTRDLECLLFIYYVTAEGKLETRAGNEVETPDLLKCWATLPGGSIIWCNIAFENGTVKRIDVI